jgi:uncharacterized membrane protein YqjE
MSTHHQDRAVEPIESDQSLGELFSRLGEDLSQLVTSQMELAREELKEEARTAGKAAGLLGAGSIVGYLALTLLCFAAAWGLSAVVHEGVAFLIVAVVVGIIAGVLMITGKKRLDDAKDPVPETRETLKEDVQWTRQQMK